MQAPIKRKEEVESSISLPVVLEKTIRSSELDFNLQRHLPAQEASGTGVDVRGEKGGRTEGGRHLRERTGSGVEVTGVDAAFGGSPSSRRGTTLSSPIRPKSPHFLSKVNPEVPANEAVSRTKGCPSRSQLRAAAPLRKTTAGGTSPASSSTTAERAAERPQSIGLSEGGRS